MAMFHVHCISFFGLLNIRLFNICVFFYFYPFLSWTLDVKSCIQCTLGSFCVSSIASWLVREKLKKKKPSKNTHFKVVFFGVVLIFNATLCLTMYFLLIFCDHFSWFFFLSRTLSFFLCGSVYVDLNVCYWLAFFLLPKHFPMNDFFFLFIRSCVLLCFQLKI